MWEVVHLAAHRLQVPADRVWKMCLADIQMNLREPETAAQSAGGNQAALMAICIEIDRRRELIAKLTMEQQVELSEWKSRLM